MNDNAVTVSVIKKNLCIGTTDSNRLDSIGAFRWRRREGISPQHSAEQFYGVWTENRLRPGDCRGGHRNADTYGQQKQRRNATTCLKT